MSIMDSPIPSTQLLDTYNLSDRIISLDTLLRSLFITNSTIELPTLDNQVAFMQETFRDIPVGLIIDDASSPHMIYGILTRYNNIIPIQKEPLQIHLIQYFV